MKLTHSSPVPYWLIKCQSKAFIYRMYGIKPCKLKGKIIRGSVAGIIVASFQDLIKQIKSVWVVASTLTAVYLPWLLGQIHRKECNSVSLC
jgi:hypothetical protein